MRIFKKLNLLLFGLIACSMLIDNASAAETNKVCKKHTNYYFMSTVVKQTDHNNALANGAVWQTEFKTSFPSLENTLKYSELGFRNGQEIEYIDSYKVCLTREDGNTDVCDGLGSYDEEWKLTEFWTKYLEATNSNNSAPFVEPVKGKETSSNISVTETNSENYLYVAHEKWFTVLSNGNVEEGGDTAVLGGISANKAQEMSKASALPDKVLFPVDFSSINIIEEPFSLNINREVKASPLNENLTGYGVAWPNETSENPSIFSPALYAIEYQVCENKVVYNATIKYLDAETKKEITDTWTKSGLVAGHEEKKASPVIKNCSPNKDVVTVSVNDSDFYTEVLYTCVNENPKTGSIFIGGIVILMFASLGYMIYYSRYKNVDEV